MSPEKWSQDKTSSETKHPQSQHPQRRNIHSQKRNIWYISETKHPQRQHPLRQKYSDTKHPPRQRQKSFRDKKSSETTSSEMEHPQGKTSSEAKPSLWDKKTLRQNPFSETKHSQRQNNIRDKTFLKTNHPQRQKSFREKYPQRQNILRDKTSSETTFSETEHSQRRNILRAKHPQTKPRNKTNSETKKTLETKPILIETKSILWDKTSSETKHHQRQHPQRRNILREETSSEKKHPQRRNILTKHPRQDILREKRDKT